MPATDNNYNESDVDEIDIDIDDSDSGINLLVAIGVPILILVCCCCLQSWLSMKIAQRTFDENKWKVSQGAKNGGFTAWFVSTIKWQYCCPCMLCCHDAKEFQDICGNIPA